MITRDRLPDSTLAMLRDGYTFVTRRCVRYGTDLFEARLLLRPTICLRGRAAAELFYDTDRFQRHDAAPRRVRATLLGEGGVQGLDGTAHRVRKAMLMSLMTPASVGDLADRFAGEWDAAIGRWERADRVVLFDEVNLMLCRAVCGWAGVPLPTTDVARRTADLFAMIDSATVPGPRHWRGRRARRRAERWIGDLVVRVRDGDLALPEDAPLRVVAEHRDHQDRPLPPRIAAVAVLNLLRPTLAIGRYVVFTAHALHRRPDLAAELRGDDDLLEPFVQEVRRYYPFFSTAVARVRRDFDWHGAHFPQGRRVLLDLYGTNHHPQVWPEPNRFDPERFRDWPGDPFALVPQGGGDFLTGHRCAGEWITIELMKVALTALTRSIEYDVPDQDLRISLRRIPATVASGFVLRRARRAATRTTMRRISLA